MQSQKVQQVRLEAGEDVGYHRETHLQHKEEKYELFLIGGDRVEKEDCVE